MQTAAERIRDSLPYPELKRKRPKVAKKILDWRAADRTDAGEVVAAIHAGVHVHDHELAVPDLREDALPQVRPQRLLRPAAQRARCKRGGGNVRQFHHGTAKPACDLGKF
jgi:hypothetical protein